MPCIILLVVVALSIAAEVVMVEVMFDVFLFFLRR